MKSTIGLKKLYVYVILLLILISCKNDHQNDKEFDYSIFIDNHTTGIQSIKNEVKLTLANELSNTDIESLGDVFSFSPKIEGDLSLINGRQLVWTPKENLASNTEYQVSLHLDVLYPEQETKPYYFDFKTKKQDFEIQTMPLATYDKNWQYIEGEIKTNDFASLEKVKEILEVMQDDVSLALKFEEINMESRSFYFKIDSIKRKKSISKISLHYDGEALGSEKQGKREIEIPGIKEFKILEVKVIDHTYIEISFSDPLLKNQNLKGLIDLESFSSSDLKMEISGNNIRVYPNRQFSGERLLKVYHGIKSAFDTKMNYVFQQKLIFEEPLPQVAFIKSGTILPSSEGLNIHFKAINLKAVDITVYRIYESNVLQFLQQNDLKGNQNLKYVARPIVKKNMPLDPIDNMVFKWQNYGIALDELIEIEPGAIYKVKIDFNINYSAYPCERTYGSARVVEQEVFDDDGESSLWDENNSEDEYDDYNWSDRKDPCSRSYYYNKSVNQNVLASDIGVTVKKGNDDSYFIFTNNLVSSAVMGEVKITFYNFQQQAIEVGSTDENGVFMTTVKKVPYVITAEKDGQITYLKVNDGNVLSISNFNTSGVKPSRGLQGFIYNERGVWRPGDTIYTAFMLNDLKNQIPTGQPVTAFLRDSYGNLIYRQSTREHLNKLYRFDIPTSTDDPTGTWNLTIIVGGASFQKDIKVETIKPNRLKVLVESSEKILEKKQDVTITSTWLHGAIAKGLEVETDLTLSPQKTKFDGYPNYVFDDPSKNEQYGPREVFSGRLNVAGKVNFPLNIGRSLTSAAGMLKATLTTRVFEEGGDFSTDVFSTTFSPYKCYVGLKRPQGDKARNMLLTDQKHLFEVVTVNKKGKAIPNKYVDVAIYKMKNSWWYNNNNNYSQFQSENLKEKVFSKKLKTNSSGKASFQFEIKYPEWGRYFVIVKDLSVGHSTGEVVFVDWPGWAGKAKKGNQKEATMLAFNTDKDKYNVGEEVAVEFPSAENGHALITIENNEGVLKHFHIQTEKGMTQFVFEAEANMKPNVYVNIKTLQPHHQTQNDLPIRMYGIQNIFVEDKETRLLPQLETPEQVVPEQNFTIKVSEDQGKAMTYTLAIVDEGLLGLTRFKTPKPWPFFNQKVALGVKNWDVYDDVIGAFGGKLNQIFSIGGDGDLSAAKSLKANRFKPVVLFKGPFELKKGKKATHTVKLPQYIGAVKVMLVAHNPASEAYGQAEKSVLVKKSLMLLATAPRKASVNEEITVPVTVFNKLETAMNVKVEINTNEVFEVIDSPKQTVNFTGSGEKMAYFKLKVKKNGLGTIQLQAKYNDHKANYSLEMDSYNPNTKVKKAQVFLVDSEGSQDVTLDAFGIENSNSVSFEVSNYPSINFNDRLRYLIRYPHGCMEQTVSKAFPQLYIPDLFEPSVHQKKQINEHVKFAIEKINNFKCSSGGFSYWPGTNKINAWVTNYAGHFLFEAKEKGYLIPYSLEDGWVNYQITQARKWNKDSEQDDLTQAYRLYTLALAKNPDLGMMNRLREGEALSDIAKLRLAMAYALIGQKQAALELMTQAKLTNYMPKQPQDYGSALINKSMAMETYLVLDEKAKALNLLTEISDALNQENYINTYTTAKCLRAVATYYQAEKGKEIEFDWKLGSQKETVDVSKSFYHQDLEIEKGMQKLTIKSESDHPLYVKVVNEGIPALSEEENISNNLLVDVKYFNSNGNPISIDKLTQGTTFFAEIKVENSTLTQVKNIALSYHVPSGWEIINNRHAGVGSQESPSVDFVDFRDNVVHYYFGLRANKELKFRVQLNTTYLGKFYLPGVHVASMYDDEFVAHTKGKWVFVSE